MNDGVKGLIKERFLSRFILFSFGINFVINDLYGAVSDSFLNRLYFDTHICVYDNS